MYTCSRCKRDVTTEVERIISGIVSSAPPGKAAPPVKLEYFEQRYECRGCTNRLAEAEMAAYRARGRRPVACGHGEEGPPGWRNQQPDASVEPLVQIPSCLDDLPKGEQK